MRIYAHRCVLRVIARAAWWSGMAVVLTAALAAAQPQSPRIGVLEEGVSQGACARLDYGPGFDVTGCAIDVAPSVTIDGDQSIGEPDDFRNCGAGGIQQGGTCVEQPYAATVTATDCDEAGELGRGQYETSGPPGARKMWCNGTAGYERQGHTLWRIGGDGSDGAESWNGTTGCTNGTINGSTCELTRNCALGLMNTSTTLWDCCYNFTTLTLSGGTLTCGPAPTVAAQPTQGSRLVLRVQSPAITAGTISMVGRGGAGIGGPVSGGTAGTRAGGSGANTAGVPAGGGGAAGNNAGAAGNQVPDPRRLLPFWPTALTITGTGGGSGASKGTAGAQGAHYTATFLETGMATLASTGGGGGGCIHTTPGDSGTTTAGGDGQRGGGAVYVEVANDWSPGTLTITTAGTAGGAGGADSAAGGGGGAGSIAIVYGRTLSDGSATYTTTGGAGGTSSGDAGCAAGGAGGAGRTTKLRAPL